MSTQQQQQPALLQSFRTNYEAYVKAWGKFATPTERTQLLDTAVTPNMTYTDPNLHMTDRAELENLMNTARKETPDVYFTVDTWQAHHSQGMAEWTAVKEGKKFLMGTDVVMFDAEGRMTALHSFFHPIDEKGEKIKQAATAN